MKLRTIYIIAMLLGMMTSAVAQPQINFDKKAHDFGDIPWKVPVTAEFALTNTGDKPLVLTQVTSSCGCTVAGWTKKPIMPGETGMVETTFDAKALGSFHKTVGVYCNAQSRPIYLSIQGRVSQHVRNYDSYPVQIGQIRIDKEELDFMEASSSAFPVEEIKVVNTGDKVYEPVLMHLPPYLTVEAVPERLKKHQAGVIRVTLDPSKLIDYGLTQSSVYLARFPGDKVSDENEIVVSAVRVPDFSRYTEAERKNAPIVHFDKTELIMDTRAGKKKVTQKLVLTNQGKSQLEIGSLQVSNPAISVSLKKRFIEPGASTTMKVTFHPHGLKKQKTSSRLLLITNDPNNPKVVIKLNVK